MGGQPKAAARVPVECRRLVLERRAARPHVTAVSQADLFKTETADELPPGFRYRLELIDRAEEKRLISEFEKLEFAPFEFQGFLGKRRVISFGWRYDFNKGGLHKAGDIPEFLWPARERAAQFAGLQPDDLQHVLLTEYPPGSTIGWHKDRSVFGCRSEQCDCVSHDLLHLPLGHVFVEDWHVGPERFGSDGVPVFTAENPQSRVEVVVPGNDARRGCFDHEWRLIAKDY